MGRLPLDAGRLDFVYCAAYNTSYYGPPLRLARTARRLHVSPAWFSWVGTEPTLRLVNRISVAAHQHDVGLANRFRAGLGLPPGDSAIDCVDVGGVAERLARAEVMASVRAGRLRTACHLYNTAADVDRGRSRPCPALPADPMGRRELAAAGISDPTLRASYQLCRRLNAAHGQTYFLATRLLPPAKRPYVHALYGFARYADEIVDDTDSSRTLKEKETALDGLVEALAGAVEGRDSVLPAVLDTSRRWDIPRTHFATFLASMRMDLRVTEYESFEDLTTYMHGSAAVVGLQMVPILEPVSTAAYAYAADLGISFQLVNFLRDIGEDLRRGRLYLPLQDLAIFGLTRADLADGVVDGRVRRLLAFEIARARELLRSARPGVRLLHPTSRECVATAATLYGGILDAIERADYQVLDRRVSVGPVRRAAVAGPAWWRATRARKRA